MKAVDWRGAAAAIGRCRSIETRRLRHGGSPRSLERKHVRKTAAATVGSKTNVRNNNTTTIENTQGSVIESRYQTRFEERTDSGFLGLLRLCGSIHSHRIGVLVWPLDKFECKFGAGKVG